MEHVNVAEVFVIFWPKPIVTLKRFALERSARLKKEIKFEFFLEQ